MSGKVQFSFMLICGRYYTKYNAKEQANKRKKEGDENVIDSGVFLLVTEKNKKNKLYNCLGYQQGINDRFSCFLQLEVHTQIYCFRRRNASLFVLRVYILIICLPNLQFIDLTVAVYMKFKIGLEIAPGITMEFTING